MKLRLAIFGLAACCLVQAETGRSAWLRYAALDPAEARQYANVVPGAVTEATFTFAKPGTFKIPCHEFCGAGHYAMRGQLHVVPQEQFGAMVPGERRTCELR